MKRAVLASLALVLPLAACGGSSPAKTAPATVSPSTSSASKVSKPHPHVEKLDHVYVANLIHRQETRQYGLARSAHVTCPGGIPIKAQTHFHCLIRANGIVTRLVVTIENRRGYLTWVVG